MKATYDISIVPAGHNAVHVYVYRDGVTRLNKTLKGQSVQAAAEAAKRLVTAELQSPLIRWKADGWNIWSAKLQHQEFVNARHQTSGRIPNSPFLTMPSREMAEAFAAAARSAGHRSVLVSTMKGRPGVMLGNMDHAEARKLADVLNKRFPQADLKVNPYMGFERLKAQLKRKGVQDPAALAASIGRKKYGKKAFQEMAATGRRRNPNYEEYPVQIDAWWNRDGKFYEYHKYSPADFEYSREEGNVTFCSQCEDWYAPIVDDNGKCFRCKGYKATPQTLEFMKKHNYPKKWIKESTVAKKATKRAKNPVQKSDGIRTVGA